MPTYNCKVCGLAFKRNGVQPGVFCSRRCKGDWQREQKPVDEVWLRQKYLVENLSTYKIGKMVGRNPKQVFNWLKGYGIETRERRWKTERDDSIPYQNEEWLRREYTELGRSSGDIASQFNVTESNIIHFLRIFSIPRRTVSETRSIKHWGASGSLNPMYGKSGSMSPSWKGGITPDRQLFYESPEWHAASSEVWRCDNGTCRRCGNTPHGRRSIHIHHIVGFAVKSLRCEVTNLVLLCQTCHRFIHSKANTSREFLVEGGTTNGR